MVQNSRRKPERTATFALFFLFLAQQQTEAPAWLEYIVSAVADSLRPLALFNARSAPASRPQDGASYPAYKSSTGSRLVPHGKHKAHALAVLMATWNA